MRLTAVPAAVLALACTLVACSGGSPEPAPLDSPEPSTSVTSAPTDAPTQTPRSSASPTATQSGQVGGKAPTDSEAAEAEAFLRRYLDEQNKATGNGDFTTVLALITDTCSLCHRSMDYISGIYAKGNKIQGGTFDEPKIEVEGVFGRRVYVDMTADVLDATIVDKSGKVVGREKGTKQRQIKYTLERSDTGKWHVVGGEAA